MEIYSIEPQGRYTVFVDANSGEVIDIIDNLQKIKTASYAVLDTELPKTGSRVNRWSIQQNLDTATIRSAIYA